MRYRTLDLDIRIRVDPGLDLGWTSSTTLSLFYGRTLIGEATLKDNCVIPDSWNEVYIEFGDIEIQDMTGFKSFVRHVIPQPRHGLRIPHRTSAVALEIVENGHKLSMAISLDTIGVANALNPTVRLTSDEIQITFRVHNPTNVTIFFQQAEFELQKDGDTLATLQSDLHIQTDHFKEECVLVGEIHVNTTELFGRAVLKGFNLDEMGYSWYIHALRQFEVEINLDELICGDD